MNKFNKGMVTLAQVMGVLITVAPGVVGLWLFFIVLDFFFGAKTAWIIFAVGAIPVLFVGYGALMEKLESDRQSQGHS